MEKTSSPPSIREADKSKTQKGGLRLFLKNPNNQYNKKTKRRKRHHKKRTRTHF